MDRLYNDVNVYKQRLIFLITYTQCYKTCFVILCLPQLHQRKRNYGRREKKTHSENVLTRTCYQ